MKWWVMLFLTVFLSGFSICILGIHPVYAFDLNPYTEGHPGNVSSDAKFKPDNLYPWDEHKKVDPWNDQKKFDPGKDQRKSPPLDQHQEIRPGEDHRKPITSYENKKPHIFNDQKNCEPFDKHNDIHPREKHKILWSRHKFPREWESIIVRKYIPVHIIREYPVDLSMRYMGFTAGDCFSDFLRVDHRDYTVNSDGDLTYYFYPDNIVVVDRDIIKCFIFNEWDGIHSGLSYEKVKRMYPEGIFCRPFSDNDNYALKYEDNNGDLLWVWFENDLVRYIEIGELNIPCN